jgi:hypothetical protein
VRRFAVLASILAGGCSDPCMENGFTRFATGSLDYTLSLEGGATTEPHGAMPAALTLRRFSTFESGSCDLDDNTFTIDVANTCRLDVIATSRDIDSGKNASHNFVQAESEIIPNQICAIRLADGRWANGRVQSGSLVIMPRTGRLSLALDVHEYDGASTRGYLRVTSDLSWR